jgi:type IV pilus assembly protein PilB
MARKKLGELLLEAGVITEGSLRTALAEQRRWGGTLGRTLIEMRAINEEELVRALSAQLGMQAVDLDAMQVPQQVIDLVPGELA